MTAVVGDHVIMAGTPQSRDASCRPYCAVADSKRNRWGSPDGGAKPDRSRNAADTYPVEIWGYGFNLFRDRVRMSKQIANVHVCLAMV